MELGVCQCASHAPLNEIKVASRSSSAPKLFASRSMHPVVTSDVSDKAGRSQGITCRQLSSPWFVTTGYDIEAVDLGSGWCPRLSGIERVVCDLALHLSYSDVGCSLAYVMKGRSTSPKSLDVGNSIPECGMQRRRRAGACRHSQTPRHQSSLAKRVFREAARPSLTTKSISRTASKVRQLLFGPSASA